MNVSTSIASDDFLCTISIHSKRKGKKIIPIALEYLYIKGELNRAQLFWADNPDWIFNYLLPALETRQATGQWPVEFVMADEPEDLDDVRVSVTELMVLQQYEDELLDMLTIANKLLNGVKGR